MQESELILNKDGSIYHLNLHPQDVAPIIITVGDPNRVEQVSKHFDKIELKKSNREFVIHTGSINSQRITCLSTGMGTDNIDIVLNELDALVNIDLITRKVKPELTSLTIIRLGTSGSINENITVGDILYSKVAIGLESLFAWYQMTQMTILEKKWHDALALKKLPVQPYIFEADQILADLFGLKFKPGSTLTCGGFYGPQNRKLRLSPSRDIVKVLKDISIDDLSPTNIEMETAGIYGLSRLLGHKAISINAIMANRTSGEFASNPQVIMESMIEDSLDLICKL